MAACVIAAALWVVVPSNGALDSPPSTATTDLTPATDGPVAAAPAPFPGGTFAMDRADGTHAVGTGGRERTSRVEAAPLPRRPRTRTVDSWKRGQQGFATYYARKFDGRRTASGSAFDNDALIAAHPRHAFGTTVRVTNLANGRSVDVRIVDRGPSRGARANGVIIDLSRAAAEALDFIRKGRARVRLDVLENAG
jgi:rare lipoprotein A